MLPKIKGTLKGIHRGLYRGYREIMDKMEVFEGSLQWGPQRTCIEDVGFGIEGFAVSFLNEPTIVAGLGFGLGFLVVVLLCRVSTIRPCKAGIRFLEHIHVKAVFRIGILIGRYYSPKESKFDVLRKCSTLQL